MSEEHYPPRLIAMLESVWGEGFLSPGGAEEVARVVGGLDLAGKAVLDIGCGAGGIDIALVRQHGAGHVLGLDVEDSVLSDGINVERYAKESAAVTQEMFIAVGRMFEQERV